MSQLDNLPPPSSTGNALDTLPPPSKSHSVGSTVPTNKEEESHPFKEIGKEGIAGGMIGAVAPELLQYVAAPASTLIPGVGEALAPMLYESGAALRGARTASALSGALSGVGGEAAGQVVEHKGGTQAQADAARLAGSLITPMPFEFLGTTAGKVLGGIGHLLGIPGTTAAKTLGSMLQDNGIDKTVLDNLSEQKRKFVEDRINAIRGGGENSYEAQRQLFSMLKKESEIQSLASQTSIDALNAKVKSVTDQILKEHQDLANKVLNDAQNVTPALRGQAKIEADNIMNQAHEQVAKLNQDANQLRQRLIQSRSSARQGATTAEQRGQQITGKYNQQGMLPTDVGNKVREIVLPRLKAFFQTRAENGNKNFDAVYKLADQKEAAGERVFNTKAAQEFVSQLEGMLKDPKTGLQNIPDGPIKNQIKSIIETFKGKKIGDEEGQTGEVITVPTKIGFKALEILRRNLRDRAYGLEPEGFSAINKDVASKLADGIEKIEKEFVGKGESSLLDHAINQWRADSQPINAFKTKFGQALSQTEDFDINRLLTDPAAIGDMAFKTRSGVNHLIELTGNPGEVENLARSYLFDRLHNANAKQIEDTLGSKEVRDWIGLFPRLKQELSTDAAELAKQERLTGKRKSLADVISKKIGGLPTAEELATKAEKITGPAIESVQKRLAAGETEIGKVTTQAEKESQRILGQAPEAVKEATTPLTKQAEQIQKESDNFNKLLLGEKVDFKEVENLLTNFDRARWEAIKPIVEKTPGAKEKIAEAISQIVARQAESSLKGAATKFKDISENLVQQGVLDKTEVNRINAEFNKIFEMPVGKQAKVNYIAKLVNRTIIGAWLGWVNLVGDKNK